MPPMSTIEQSLNEMAPRSSSPTTVVSKTNDGQHAFASPLLEMASIELDFMRRHSSSSCSDSLHRFPPACLELLRTLPGNHKCMDCNAVDPDWATVSYGGLVCLNCSGGHRGLGVKVSVVRSIFLDHWSHDQVLAMLEGGNQQLSDFFRRHDLSAASAKEISPNDGTYRYKTKAALFYRNNLGIHIRKLSAAGPYRGREFSRRKRPQTPKGTGSPKSPSNPESDKRSNETEKVQQNRISVAA